MSYKAPADRRSSRRLQWRGPHFASPSSAGPVSLSSGHLGVLMTRVQQVETRPLRLAIHVRPDVRSPGPISEASSLLMDKPRWMVQRSDDPHPRLVLRTTSRMISRNSPVSHEQNTNSSSRQCSYIIRVRGWNRFEYGKNEMSVSRFLVVLISLIVCAAPQRFVITDEYMFTYYCIITCLTTM